MVVSRRRALLKAIAFVATPLATGACAIKMANPRASRSSAYTEVVDTVLLSQDIQHLAVVGSTYDYLFQNSEQLAALLRSAVHPYLSAEFAGFEVGSENVVHGNLVLYLRDHDEWALEEAKRLGFTLGFTGEFYLQLAMRGTRHRKNPQVRVGEAYKLNRRYTVAVNAAHQTEQNRPAPMPLQVAVGGALLLVGLPVVVLFALVRPRK